MIRHNLLKTKLERGETVFGTWTKIADPAAIEVLALAGFDFTVIDREHVAFDNERIFDLVRAAELSGICPIIRPRENNASLILHALDAGALGVQVPGIDTPDQARAVVRAAKYAPLGERGFATSHRAGGYGTVPMQDYLRLSNAETLVICYVESRAACENLAATAQIEGVDVLFIGPFDLSQSLGYIGQFDHPAVKGAIDQAIETTNAAGKVAGIIAKDADEASFWAEKGCRYITIASDLGLLVAQGRKWLGALKNPLD